MDYIDILNSDFFKESYTTIEELKKDFPVNHGFIHINHVISNAKTCAKVFKLTQNQEKLLLIAAALHDVGYLKGRDDHDLNGAPIAREFLSSSDLSPDQIETICSAIANHGGDTIDAYKDPISLCLILSDKLDFVGSRYRKDIPNTEKYKPYYNILKTEIDYKNDTLILIITTPSKEANELFNSCSYCQKLHTKLNLAAKALGCDYQIKYINKQEEKTQD